MTVRLFAILSIALPALAARVATEEYVTNRVHGVALRVAAVSQEVAAVSSSVTGLAFSVSALSASVDAVDALSRTNRVTRWYDPEDTNRYAVLEGGTNIVIYRSMVTGTNFIVTLSADFEELLGNTRPAWTNHVWPFDDGAWTGRVSEGSQLLTCATGAAWIGSGGYPVEMLPFSYGSGSATVSIDSYTYSTNVEWRYYLPTNAIPPELANLDNLQGWLNNLYAMKSVVDGHITDGAHTNVTLAGTVTIGGVARTDWPVGATNLVVGATSVPYDAATRTFDGALLDPALPYRAWTGVVTPANGTATVAYAHGNMPVLTIAGATVLTLDPAGYGTGGVSRVSLTLWTGTNTLTLATNVVSYAATPTVSTNAWNTILFRRAGNSSWKGVGL